LKELTNAQFPSKSTTATDPTTPEKPIPPPPTTKPSTIKKKIISSSRRLLYSSSSDDDEEYSSSDDDEENSSSDDESEDSNEFSDINLIINIQKILSLVNCMNCPKCNSHGHYNYKITKRLGLSFYISFICTCGNVIRLSTGARLEISPTSQMTDLNVLSVLAGSLVGLQRTGMKKFFGAMGILPPVKIKSFKRYEHLLSKSIEHVAKVSMGVAAEEARLYHNSDDISISIDGTWLTQGFTSLHGVGTVVSVSDPPKVLDFEVLTRHCSTCAGLMGIRQRDGELYAELLERHFESGCDANYQGSSGGMEGSAVGHFHTFIMLTFLT
jgi:hypothetical protein